MNNSPILQKALQTVENIEPPAIGFAKSSGISGLGSLADIVVKQNNTQLQLLISIAENLGIIKEELKKITTSSNPPSIPDDLINKLRNLSLGPKEKKEHNGTLRVFRDPYLIAKEEKEKAKLLYKF